MGPGRYKIYFIIFLTALLFPGMLSAQSSPDSVKVSVIKDTTVLTSTDSLASAQDSLSAMAKDSLSTVQDSLSTVKDSLLNVSYSLPSIKDSLSAGAADSTSTGQSDDMFAAMDSTSVADSVRIYTEKELKKMHRDSVRAYKDSVRLALPRILETCAVPDSLMFKRIFSWTSDSKTNRMTEARIDTTYNDWYTEAPFMHQDINATYLGVMGSPTQLYNFFKRDDGIDIFPAYSPYLSYSYTPETMPMYNVKSTYTELAYWGTIFDYKDKEEANIKILHTQNITPAFNLAFMYEKFGGKGLLENEETSNKTLTVTGNYLGKRYVLNAGFIHNNVKRYENGGVQDSWWVRDTTVEAKTIEINLTDAKNMLSRNTGFVHHYYNIPLKRMMNDSTPMPIDEGPMISVGHIGEISRYFKHYTDEIALTDSAGRAFYNNAFYINPTASSDSIRVLRFENKFFFKLQPYAKDAVLSNITGGVGIQYLNIFSFEKTMFFTGNSNKYQNNMYVYAGAGGTFKKYLHWEANGQYDFAGYYQNDFSIDANMTVSFYPFKDKKDGVDLTARFETSLKRPDYFANHLYSNHYVWDNDFGKKSVTKVEGQIDIKKWKLQLFFGYSLLNNYVYYDTLGIVRQNDGLINVMSAYLKKDFKLWHFHLNNQILFQYSSNTDILPLPMLSAHLRYYFEYPLVKNVLSMQIGVDGTWETAYYAQSYNPVVGQFQLQNRELVGNCPYLDVFVNLQWKRASIFVKVLNVAQGWPTGDYFSALGYIKPKRGFKVGIHWPFYFK